jgi:hypothetical protein
VIQAVGRAALALALVGVVADQRTLGRLGHGQRRRQSDYLVSSA